MYVLEPVQHCKRVDNHLAGVARAHLVMATPFENVHLEFHLSATGDEHDSSAVHINNVVLRAEAAFAHLYLMHLSDLNHHFSTLPHLQYLVLESPARDDTVNIEEEMVGLSGRIIRRTCVEAKQIAERVKTGKPSLGAPYILSPIWMDDADPRREYW